MSLFKTIQRITGHECSDLELQIIRGSINDDETRDVKKVSPEKIIELICNKNGITVQELTSKDRHRPLPDIRKICCLLLSKNGYIHERIAKVMNMKRSSVTHAILKDRELANDNEYKFLKLKSGVEF